MTKDGRQKTEKAQALVSRLLSSALCVLIAVYRYTLSYFIGRACRFTPSCSEYAAEAITIHGPWCGGKMALGRISRCRPGGGSGFDPVPEKGSGENAL